ncbi:MAG: FAD-binding oxidoreductase [Rhodospirillaceae bacterium]|nr:FAD-binding oxidoreductase [Rhodospirillaceae bacterium]
MNKADIIIIGGAITGSSAAYFLSKDGRAGRVVVIETDSTYERATTPQAAGGIRQLFSRPENIAMSQFGLPFYQTFDEDMAVEDETPGVNFRFKGYLFVATSDNEAEIMRSNADVQTAAGAKVELMDGTAMQARFPSMSADDVKLACYSSDDGWIEPSAALWGFRKKAVSLGAEYVQGRVMGMDTEGTAVRRLHLESGDVWEAGAVINAAGPWAGEVAAMAGVDVPVAPMSRAAYFWRCAEPVEDLPLIKDDHKLFIRAEGDGFIGGAPTFEIKPGFNWDFDRGYFADYFEKTVWPLLAQRVPKFERIKLERTFGGHYSENLFDANMIIGRISKEIENLYMAAGFSGHGIMHAPAVGRALAELILDGEFKSLDLTRLGMQRVWDDTPYPELGIK